MFLFLGNYCKLLAYHKRILNPNFGIKKKWKKNSYISLFIRNDLIQYCYTFLKTIEQYFYVKNRSEYQHFSQSTKVEI